MTSTTDDPTTHDTIVVRLMEENTTLKNEVSTLNSANSTLNSANFTLNSENSNLTQRLMEQVRRDNEAGPLNQHTPFSVTNYLPAMLLKIISERGNLEEASVQQHRNSTLLFLDISGYTKLAESMGKEGPAGTEKLSKALSIFFEKAIKIIDNNGGDVISFCGDALLTVFPSEGELVSPGEGDDDDDSDNVISRRLKLSASEESKRHVEAFARVRLTVQCALEAMAALSPYVISESVTLDLKIMVGFGTLSSHVVASSSRATFLVTGEPLAQITKGEHLAAPGKIIISSEAQAMCKDNISVASIVDTTEFVQLMGLVGAAAAQKRDPPIKITPNHLLVCARGLEKTTVEELLKTGEMWTRNKLLYTSLDNGLSKHTTCTTVFVMPKSDRIYSKNSLVVNKALQQIFLIAHTICEKFNGFFRQFVFDDKGLGKYS